jgi:RND family efflux transporter MFP subunit
MENSNSDNTNKKNNKGEPAITVGRKPFSLAQRFYVVAIAIVFLIVIAIGIRYRRAASTVLAEATDHAAVPVVNVTPVAAAERTADVVLPGTTESFAEAAVYARTNGYLKKWYFDIGAHVRKGQLLAEIDTPELDQQLKQARHDLSTAKENEQLALITTTRWQHLVTDDAVSKQEAETYLSDYKAKQFITSSAAANVGRLEQLQSFEKIYAPFDGVITARNTDIGDLINAGGGGPKELFHMAAVSRLRIYVSVPEADLSIVRQGGFVGLTLDEYPDRTFQGTIVRTSDAIDQTTRTLNVEIDIDNTKDEIKTGAYVLAHFRSSDPKNKSGKNLMIPANTVLFRSEGLRAAVVRDGKAQLIPITIGRDYGTTLEITSGLSQGDKVILNPSDSLTTGTLVQVASENREGGQ